MNYIDQIKVFKLLGVAHLFGGNENRLHFFLQKLSNLFCHKDPLTNANGHTTRTVGMTIVTPESLENCSGKLWKGMDKVSKFDT